MIPLAALIVGVAALALRTVGSWAFVVPLAGGASALLVMPRLKASTHRLPVTAAGIVAFAVVRLAHPATSLRATTAALAASAAAAIGEELLFRHGVYGLLERKGPLIAVIASALLFGLVHAPIYGWSVVPLDVAAGFVFGWQRWATGSWTAPAATHVFANLIGAL